MTWAREVGLALTRLGNALIGGLATESLSSRAYRMEHKGKPWGDFTRPFIDGLFRIFGQREHCAQAYQADRSHPPLPLLGE